ncbi:hypothetical protein B0A55_03616 [Friedmanniomyces simplex]|uniref:Cryptic loci regulator 2 N-terminal domain-containing protein n=1 Tax=Friedmanniomyces simplex TaxID=329884 RepID=A0A4U0XTL0_9PEZI|nr:hypothetical protein B0A55_03616 [Friedmanniomyces simplex]
MSVVVLPITGGSDGDDRRRPKIESHTRNDEYWLQRIGEEWAKSLGRPKGNSYRIDKLPVGYAGWEKGRGGDSKHVDRYLYGHVRGPARSIPDIMPHFKFLMENGNAFGCVCKLCVSGSRIKGLGVAGEKSSSRGDSPAQQSQYFAPPTAPPSRGQYYAPPPPPGPNAVGRPRTLLDVSKQRDVEMSPPLRRKQVDEEGTPDAIRLLLDRLKDAGAEGKIDEPIFESLSLDWRTGHTMLMETLREWSKLPGYVPRVGELVLFVRQLGPHESLGWDKNTWRAIDLSSRSWADKPKWEAGVITQMPTEAVSDADLSGVPSSKQHSVVDTGFRIEPLPQPNSVDKSLTRKHKYVPLHAIRPLALWKECLSGVDQPDWHPTVGNALTVASSFCVLGKYHFKGTWPEATVFAQAVYLGPEIVTIGDAVRLQNKTGDTETVTDIMVITAIKIRIVNLDEASDDDLDDGHPYNTCTHISGRVYTQDPTRSFDGIGKLPISAASPLLPIDLGELGTWYHVTDPKKTKARIEVPFQRVIGRCYEIAALQAWFTPPPDIAPPSTFQAVNTKPPAIQVNSRALASPATLNISRGLPGILEARAYSLRHDVRIATEDAKTWFWADTRIEQLDIQEVNSRFVGARNEMRRPEQLGGLRKALRALDGRKGGVKEYHAARREREEGLARRSEELGASMAGLVAGGALAAGAVGAGLSGMGDVERSSVDGEEEEDAMEVDEQLKTDLKSAIATDVMELDDDEEEDEDAGAALAAFKMAPTAKKPGHEVVELDSDEEMR